MATVEKEFLAAKDAQRYRDYPLAEQLLLKVLEKDPFHLEARKETCIPLSPNGAIRKSIRNRQYRLAN